MKLARLAAGLALLALAGMALLPGCAGPGYYVQAASGHLALMRSREDIDDYLAEAAPDDPLAGRLRLAQDITAWAGDAAGLPDEGSYQTFARTNREAVVWNVVAAPEFSLEPKTWCFVVAGCVPYRGYFKQEKAERLADKLRGKGYDVSVSRASAYSTLGWFEDPLLDTVLNQPDAWLAATLLHELAHQRLYVESDTRFSESYATFVEQAAVSRWLESEGRDDELAHWRRVREANDWFSARLRQARSELAELYAGDLEPDAMRIAKQAALTAMNTDWVAWRASRDGMPDVYGGWLSGEMNNADLALVSAYQGGACAFQHLFEESGQNFEVFHDLAMRQSKLEPAARSAWLDQPC